MCTATGWSSTFEMITHYFELQSFIDLSYGEIAVLTPNALENLRFKTIYGGHQKN